MNQPVLLPPQAEFTVAENIAFLSSCDEVRCGNTYFFFSIYPEGRKYHQSQPGQQPQLQRNYFAVYHQDTYKDGQTDSTLGSAILFVFACKHISTVVTHSEPFPPCKETLIKSKLDTNPLSIVQKGCIQFIWNDNIRVLILPFLSIL